jgi:hypothetical protein
MSWSTLFLSNMDPTRFYNTEFLITVKLNNFDIFLWAEAKLYFHPPFSPEMYTCGVCE